LGRLLFFSLVIVRGKKRKRPAPFFTLYFLLVIRCSSPFLSPPFFSTGYTRKDHGDKTPFSFPPPLLLNGFILCTRVRASALFFFLSFLFLRLSTDIADDGATSSLFFFPLSPQLPSSTHWPRSGFLFFNKLQFSICERKKSIWSAPSPFSSLFPLFPSLVSVTRTAFQTDRSWLSPFFFPFPCSCGGRRVSESGPLPPLYLFREIDLLAHLHSSSSSFFSPPLFHPGTR